MAQWKRHLQQSLMRRTPHVSYSTIASILLILRYRENLPSGRSPLKGKVGRTRKSKSFERGRRSKPKPILVEGYTLGRRKPDRGLVEPTNNQPTFGKEGATYIKGLGFAGLHRVIMLPEHCHHHLIQQQTAQSSSRSPLPPQLSFLPPKTNLYTTT